MITVDELEETICVMLHRRGWVPDGPTWRYEPVHRRITRLVQDHVHDPAGPLAPSIELDDYHVLTYSAGMCSGRSCPSHRQEQQHFEHPALLASGGIAEFEEHLAALEAAAMTLDLGEMLDCATEGPCRQHREEFRAFLLDLSGLDKPATIDAPLPDDHEPSPSDLAIIYNGELGVVYSDLAVALNEADSYLTRARGHAKILHDTLNFDLPGELQPRERADLLDDLRAANRTVRDLHRIADARIDRVTDDQPILDSHWTLPDDPGKRRRLLDVLRTRDLRKHGPPATAGPVDRGVTMTDPRQTDPAVARARGVAFLRPVPGVGDQ